MGFALRPTGGEDLAVVHALHRRIEVADRIPIVTPFEEFTEWLDDPHLSLADDTRVAEADGGVVGWARVWYRPSEIIQARAFLMGGVDPGWRRRGIGGALLGWQLERARAILAGAPAHLPRFIRTQAFDFEREAIALYQRHGLVPVRYADQMSRPLAALEPVPAIAGIAAIPWDDRRAEETRALYNLTFAEQWGTTPLDPAAWAHKLAAFGVRTDLSFMALDADRLVGFSLNAHYPGDLEVTGRSDGWVMSLGTDPAYRKRGIASALVLASCHRFRVAGFDHAALGVDSESLTGAHLLYRRLGFHTLHRSVTHELAI